MFMKRALIIGIGGQDGAYLAKLLLDKGYQVFGTSRDATTSSFANLSKLGILGRVENFSLAINDFRSVITTIKKTNPDEIYNLAGQTSVGLSFEQPVETMESISIGTLNLLEAIRFIGNPIRFYSAGSSECFGDVGNLAATEDTPFSPMSPYAVAKVAAYGLIANYRAAYNIFACSGILFNHESLLRPDRFVTQKIVQTAYRISLGSNEKLCLGNLNIYRDWGWAPEYVEAMWLMLQQEKPDDFIIATGRTVSLKYFVEKSFDYFDLNAQDFLEIDKRLFRPSDIHTGRADPSKAKNILGWSNKYDVDDVIKDMCSFMQSNKL